MREIVLTHNKGVAIVDDEDFEWLSKYKWHIIPNGYAMRKNRKEHALMHRQIVNAPKGWEVDHINKNKLDNRKCNLRLATHAQNQIHKKVTCRSIVGLKVCLDQEKSFTQLCRSIKNISI